MDLYLKVNTPFGELFYGICYVSVVTLGCVRWLHRPDSFWFRPIKSQNQSFFTHFHTSPLSIYPRNEDYSKRGSLSRGREVELLTLLSNRGGKRITGEKS